MPHIGNELQAFEAHPDLEDTTSTGGMAVLLLKLCSCTLKCGNSAQCCTLLLTPLLPVEWQTRLAFQANYTSS